MAFLNILNNSDTADGATSADVTEEVLSIYKNVTEEDGSVDSNLDDLDAGDKDSIVTQALQRFNVDAPDGTEFHTLGDLIDFIQSHDGTTTADCAWNLLNRSNRDKYNMLHSQLDCMVELLNNGYSNESFFSGLSDVLLGMVNTFKANVFRFTKSIKRSELRLFSDNHVNLCAEVERTDYLKLKDMRVDAPCGLNGTFATAVEYVEAVYTQLDATNYIDSVQADLARILYQLSNNNFKDTEIPSTKFSEDKAKVVKWAEATGKKIFTDKNSTGKVAFKTVYGSMQEFASVRSKLLMLEPRLQEVNAFSDKLDQLSATLGNITNVVGARQDQLPPKFLKDLAASIRAAGECFDLFGQNVMRQMSLEHNHVLNYLNLYKAL